MTGTRELGDLVRESVRGLLADPDPVALPGLLVDAGWADFLQDDPLLAVTALFTEHGRLLRSSRALDLVAMHGMGMRADASCAVLLPSLAAGGEPSSRIAEREVHLDGLLLAGHSGAATLLVPVRDGTGRHRVVRLDTQTVEPAPMPGLDPDLGLSVVEGAAPLPPEPPVHRPWEKALALARTAVAAELTGVARGTLDVAVAHVSARTQFGRPLGANQAVKHRLADVLVAVTAAEAVLEALPPVPEEPHGLAAKAVAGRAADLAARQAMQVCGAMGFTDEFALHRRVRRAQMLDALLGSSARLTGEAGRRLVETGSVPELFGL